MSPGADLHMGRGVTHKHRRAPPGGAGGGWGCYKRVVAMIATHACEPALLASTNVMLLQEEDVGALALSRS